MYAFVYFCNHFPGFFGLQLYHSEGLGNGRKNERQVGGREREEGNELVSALFWQEGDPPILAYPKLLM